MVGILVSYWGRLFSGAMLVSGRVDGWMFWGSGAGHWFGIFAEVFSEIPCQKSLCEVGSQQLSQGVIYDMISLGFQRLLFAVFFPDEDDCFTKVCEFTIPGNSYFYSQKGTCRDLTDFFWGIDDWNSLYWQVPFILVPCKSTWTIWLEHTRHFSLSNFPKYGAPIWVLMSQQQIGNFGIYTPQKYKKKHTWHILGDRLIPQQLLWVDRGILHESNPLKVY